VLRRLPVLLGVVVTVGCGQPGDHPLLNRLRILNKEAETRFPGRYDPGLGSLGLILDQRLDQSRYSTCTPINCRTFAHTGGEGVHFSLLMTGDTIDESSPVVITIPEIGRSFIVGENLFDFLCLGVHRGYFALEQLAFHPDLTLEAFTNSSRQPTESWHGSVGFDPDDDEKQILAFLVQELGLRPWAGPERFALLQKRHAQKLLIPPQT
jgi:hypothetical protein